MAEQRTALSETNIMCTPQIQQAIANAQSPSIPPSQNITPQAAMAAGQIGASMGGTNNQPVSPQMAASIQSISEMFDPNTGRTIRRLGPPTNMPVVPITKEEFDGPVISDSINSIPQHMMRKEYYPMPLVQPIKRSPTVGEILGIPPGSVPGI